MQKKVYESAEIKIVLLNRDLLITSGGSLGENEWDEFNYSNLG